jgi:hypothetical protein
MAYPVDAIERDIHANTLTHDNATPRFMREPSLRPMCRYALYTIRGRAAFPSAHDVPAFFADDPHPGVGLSIM